MTALFAAGADVNVDFDLSVVAQIALFALFITVLKPVLFDPLLRLFEERERRTDGARAEARKMDEKAAELLARFEAEIELVRREAAAERDKLRAETRELEARVLDEAKRDAARILKQGRERIQSEVQSLKKELDSSRPQLASEIAGKLLGREVQS
jgi:F-type H+-transporting ATPase subunit b